MVDKFSKKVRSKIMSRIRGKNTRPELLLRSELHKAGFRYSLKYRFKEMNFVPDIVMVSKRTCVFVDGCFWHGCPKCFKKPKSNKKYWNKKIKRNIERDMEQNLYLKKY
jgi:DNA mismatch endonuclease (patch repair protein)